jgi:DNA-binding beta-propeller fold protein YncE
LKTAFAFVAAGLLLAVPAGPASAAPRASGPVTLVEHLVTPLHVSASVGESVVVSQEFAGMLTRVEGGEPTTLYAPPAEGGWDVAGTATRGSTTYVLQSQGAGGFDGKPLRGVLQAIDAKGGVRTVTAGIAQYEIHHNPDGAQHYGVPASAAECIAEWTAAEPPIPIGASYTGHVDSHAYAMAVQGNTAYVADAGGNDVLAVNLTTGTIRTVAVLPPRPTTIPADLAAGLGAPACGGLTYDFEAVPTDVAIGPDGWLYVSSLPGGPEDPSLGARGAVFRVNPSTGEVQDWVEEVLSPTGIAFDGSGNLYIASLFGAGILKVAAGTTAATVFLEAPLTADVTVKGNTLYATTSALPGEGEPPNGMLISLRL